jgi:hypothetical protein
MSIISKWSLSLLALTVILVTVFGCPNGNGASGATSIDIRVREINRSGLQILLMPENDNSLLVETEGSISAKLWFQSDFSPNIEKGYLIQEWNDISITGEDYTPSRGAAIDLNYNEERVLLNIYGILEVTLTLPDGKTLDVEKYDLMISEEYR